MDQIENDVETTSLHGANRSPDLVAQRPESNTLGGLSSGPGQLVPGQIVSERYKIISVIGQGAMGCVYKVEQILLKKQLALKTLHSVVPSDSTRVRFQKEAQATSRLEHPNLARAIDFGLLEDGHPFFVMEFVEGPTLCDQLKSVGRLPIDVALEIFIPICFAMDYAHQAGIIHRDIKPGNIILIPSHDPKSPFIPKIVDFGIAKIESDGQALTKTGEIFGTPLYMSPEQCDGVGISHQSDIYSLGCVLYESLTGAPPFQGQSALSTMMQHRSATPPSLKEASLGLEFPETLEKIVAKMLAKDPNDRYQSCLQVAEDLIALKQGSPALVQENVVQKEQPHIKTASRRYVGLTIAAAVLAVAAAGIVFTINLSKKPAVTAGPEVITPPISQNPASVASPQAEDENRNPDPGSFCKDRRKLTFDIPHMYNMGFFYWWSGSRPEKTRAEGEFTIPSTAILRLSPNVHSYHTGYLTGFSDGDFRAICIDRHEVPIAFTDLLTLNRTLFALREFPSLRILWVKGSKKHGAISVEGLKSINRLEGLRWLMIEDCMTSGDNLAKYVNLHKLQVLCANHMNTATPILNGLSPRGQDKSPLRALSLNGCHLTPSDFKMVCQFRDLTTLSLRDDYALDMEKTIEVAAHLPRLQRLSISVTDLTPRCLESFKTMKNLKILLLANRITPDGIEQIKKALPPQCVVRSTAGEVEKADEWFNPLTEDPVRYGIWNKR
jgi:serine/threonine protein kinase